MKVLIVSSNDISGGAARCAYRLHKGLQNINIDSNMLVQSKMSDDCTVIGPTTKIKKAIALATPAIDKLEVYKYRNRKKEVMFSVSMLPGDTIKDIKKINPDVVHLHRVTNGFVKIESLKKINKPIIWTLHDMWAFTGGCHYDEECGKYKENCGECPILKSNKERDLSRKIFNRKHKMYKEINNLTIVTPSNWLADCVKNSTLLNNKRVEVIPNGIDTKIYKPIEKKLAREILNFPIDKKLIMFGALKSTTIKRKGYDYLISALKKIKCKNAEIVVFGASESAIEIDLKFKMHYFSSLYDDISLSILYSAADVMVVPSIQENLGNTIMESLSCGTPVVAFDIGGNSDMIEHKQNGYLARAFDSTNLAEGIDYVIADENRQKSLSNEARKKIKERFDINIISKRYLKLYKEHC